MDRRDWNLLALAAANGEPLAPAQLQKSLFLLAKNFESVVGDNFYQFRPYHYGPFDSTVYHDARNLEMDGHAIIREVPGSKWSNYAATAEGMARAAELKKSAPSAAVEYLERAVTWARSLTFQQLVGAIYESFPEYRENSVFRGD